MGGADSAEAGAGRGRLVVTVAILLFVVPVAVDLAVGGLRHVFDYVASDGYYYFVVGRNIAALGRVSFDGTLPTNGFHPIWQGLCAAAFFLGRLLHAPDLSIVIALLVLGIALIAVALAALGRGLGATAGGLGWGYATLPVGAYAVLVLPLWLAERQVAYPVYGTLYSYVNGMESAAVLCAYGLCAAWFLGGRALADDRGALVQGLLLALLVLCRLDTIFVAGAVLCALAVLGWPSAPGRVLRCALAFALPIALYLIANRLYAGSAMPISGAIKSSFPHLHQHNLERIKASLRAPTTQSLYRMYRLAQLILPVFAALAQLALTTLLRGPRWRDPSSARARRELWLAGTAVGVIAVSLYDLAYVELAEHGPWYHPVGTLFCSLWIVLTLSRLRRQAAGPRETAIGLGLVTAVSLLFFMRLGRGVHGNESFARFYLDEAPLVRAHYGDRPPRFIEVDDGIFSFATGYHALSGKGFSLDVVGARALERGALVPLGLARGFDRVTSVLYMHAYGYSSRTPSDRVCRLISGITPSELCADYRFSIEYTHEHFAVVRVEPLAKDAALPPN